jgi:co-chaperonin GroES (HSP10)
VAFFLLNIEKIYKFTLNMSVKPLNHVLVEMEAPLVEEIILNGGLKLFIDGSYNVEWNCTVTGKVVGSPKFMSNLSAGDEVAFSYSVVADTTFGTAGDYFKPTTEGNDYCQRFVDSYGNTLSITALPPVFGKFKKIWVGLLVDKYGQHLDGSQGDESTVKRWMSQFKFSGVQDLKYKNLIDVDGFVFWKAMPTDIYAKKVGDEIVAVGDRVICKPIETDIKYRMELESGIKLPAQSVKMRYYDRAEVISGGEEIGLKKGDIVSFDEKYVEKYDFWDKHYFIIKTKRIDGIWEQ